MNVTRIRLKNRKNFQNVDVPLCPRTFLLGANAAGKSNFLDALRFMADVAMHGANLAVQLRGGLPGLHCLNSHEESDICLAFTLDGTWDYELELTEFEDFPVLIKKECVRKDGKSILKRPDDADKADMERRTQTALEQVCANQGFRDIANFFKSVTYRHILPQLVRDSQAFSPHPVTNDPYGRNFVRQIWAVPASARATKLRHIATAPQLFIPTLSGLRVEADAIGRPTCWQNFAAVMLMGAFWMKELVQKMPAKFLCSISLFLPQYPHIYCHRKLLYLPKYTL